MNWAKTRAKFGSFLRPITSGITGRFGAAVRRFERVLGDLLERIKRQPTASSADPSQGAQQRFEPFAVEPRAVRWTWSPGAGLDEVAQAHRWWKGVGGQPQSDHLRDEVGWLELVHPDDREIAISIRERVLTECFSFDLEYRLRSRDGKWRYVHCRAVPVCGPGGAVREWIGSLTDVTEYRLAAA
jgi:hypothetical protein